MDVPFAARERGDGDRVTIQSISSYCLAFLSAGHGNKGVTASLRPFSDMLNSPCEMRRALSVFTFPNPLKGLLACAVCLRFLYL